MMFWSDHDMSGWVRRHGNRNGVVLGPHHRRHHRPGPLAPPALPPEYHRAPALQRLRNIGAAAGRPVRPRGDRRDRNTATASEVLHSTPPLTLPERLRSRAATIPNSPNAVRLRALGALGLLGSRSAARVAAGTRRAPPRQPRGPTGRQRHDGRANMGQYMEMFARHSEIHRTVTAIPAECGPPPNRPPELTGPTASTRVRCVPRLNRASHHGGATSATPARPGPQRRQLPAPPHTGPHRCRIEETSTTPALTQVIRDHAREVRGFVADGMPAALQPMMGGMGHGTGGTWAAWDGPRRDGGMGGGMGHS